MKKYTLTIVYNEQSDRLESLEEKIVNVAPKKKAFKVDVPASFSEQLDDMNPQDRDKVFELVVTNCGGVMPDA